MKRGDSGGPSAAMKLVISAGAVAPTAERAVSRGLDLDHLLRDARGTRKRRD